jgi:hypothetical protein
VRPWLGNEPIDEYISIDKQYMQTSGLLISSKLLNEVKFDRSLRKHQDIDLILSLRLCNADFIFSDQASVIFDNSQSTGRVSISHDSQPTLDFLKKWGDHLTLRTVKYYKLSIIAPLLIRSSPLLALQIYFSTLPFGIILLKEAIDGFLRYNVPVSVYDFLRMLFRKYLSRCFRGKIS